MASASVAGSVGEVADAMPSHAADAIPLVVLPAETTRAPEHLDAISRYGEDSRTQDHLLDVSKSATCASRTPAYPYPKRAFLSKYIAAVDPENPRADTLRVKMAKRKTMLRIQILLALTILVANIVVTVWAIATSPPNYQGVGTLSFGNCSKINSINGAVHLALNIVSSLFLGAGNYCMQILVAPSRQEMDRAHSKGISLDIGVPNVKNLWYINRGRVIVWALIGMLATLLHLFWNSAIFVSFAYVSYPRVTVTSDFLTVSDDWSISNLHAIEPMCNIDTGVEFNNIYQNISSIYSLHNAAKNFTRLEKMACIENFINPLSATRALAVVALNVTSAQNGGSSLLYGGLSGCWDVWNRSHFWICAAYNKSWSRWCSLDWASTFVDRWIETYSATPFGPRALIDYCLVGDPGDNSQKCAIHYSAYILPVVCACTCLQSLLIFWTWLKHREKTMLTIGDAISDFLEHPDVVMVDLGTGNTIRATRNPKPLILTEAPWVHEHLSWFKVISIRIWAISLVLFAIVLTCAFILLGIAISSLESSNTIMGSLGIWKLGFGVNAAELIKHTLWTSSSKELDLLEKLLVANGYQLLVSFLYIFYNNILTRQLVADEWTRFLRPYGKKPLRVSSPVGMQRSSYTLSLPMTYSVPLMISFMLLHYLISQSVFLVMADAFGPGPEIYRLPNYDKSDVGFSALGIIFSASLAVLLVTALLINAVMRRYKDVPTGFPAMGTSSLAISAACQPPKDDNEAHLFELRLGIVKDEEYNNPQVIGRLTFSTSIYIQEPEVGVVYRQPAMSPQEPSKTMIRNIWELSCKYFRAGVGRFRKHINLSIMSKRKQR
ncbi:hypothetical protein N431DRAFT_482041 [Stipitochalara longipes BDJ]|nr:hypothetical protein N431DRAFT_482041 [Stipitochalara longipes BDJ]